MPSVSDARAVAELTLAEHLPDRWRHVQAVAREAIRIADVDGVDRDALIVSAVLHDIGHSPVVRRTGFAPLDGARFLGARGYDRRVAALVAHHAGAATVAAARDVAGLAAYEDEATPTRDALWYCEAVSGPRGERTAPDPLAIAEPELRAAVERTQARMAAAGLAGAGEAVRSPP